MTRQSLAPFRVLPADSASFVQGGLRFSFSSPGISRVGAVEVRPGEFTLGSDSDWDPDRHELMIRCALGDRAPLRALFGVRGIAREDAVLLLALEWTSASSGSRKLGPPNRLALPNCDDHSLTDLQLSLEPASVRGTGWVSVLVMVEDPGRGAASEGFAVRAGARLGALASASVVVDGSGSLFPVEEVQRGRDGALWELKPEWIDPLDDPFTDDYVALVLNTEHPLYSQLREARAAGGTREPLMRMCLAGWMVAFILQVKCDIGDTLMHMAQGTEPLDSETIAGTAARFLRDGNLDVSSPAALSASVQRWLDRRTSEAEKPG